MMLIFKLEANKTSEDGNTLLACKQEVIKTDCQGALIGWKNTC